jgi:alpha-1,2-mannosyltransferase
VDWYYYGKPVIAVWNILFYNVLNPTSGLFDLVSLCLFVSTLLARSTIIHFDTTGGSQLYGVEPWNYYFVNLFLNFNIIFFLALCSLPVSFYS